jgi:protein SCO1/2
MSTPATGFRAPPPWVVFLFLLLGVAALGAAFFFPIRPPVPASPEARVTPPEYPTAPPFVLTERLGTTVDNSDLDGKVWVASFAFTRCKYCPQVSSTMGRLRSEMKLADRDDFRLVTFTIDPEHDTPDELKKYAGRFTDQADPRWLFLHGPERFIRLLCERGFKVVVRKVEGAEESLMYEHFLDLMVIDKKGRVRGIYPGKPPEREGGDETFTAGFDEMKTKVAELLKE